MTELSDIIGNGQPRVGEAAPVEGAMRNLTIDTDPQSVEGILPDDDAMMEVVNEDPGIPESERLTKESAERTILDLSTQLGRLSSIHGGLLLKSMVDKSPGLAARCKEVEAEAKEKREAIAAFQLILRDLKLSETEDAQSVSGTGATYSKDGVELKITLASDCPRFPLTRGTARHLATVTCQSGRKALSECTGIPVRAPQTW
ncbi:hypothetical protein EMPS_01764 [Entomortierella parvispora]|uniref:Uncharacterized protein n=1 Tax=Entomortierella parvispora TaxID=205924 RepID=A0A9P3H464_9FUNG|nr:hypothetical protein EMPS_01764 [Entomortierella parvispora]